MPRFVRSSAPLLVAMAAAALASCDGAEPRPPGFSLTIDVRTVGGQPAAGVPVYARIPYGPAFAPAGRAAAVVAVYPNPFGGATSVRISQSAAGQATVEVADLGGERVETLAAGTIQAGDHVYLWNPSPATSGGVYHVRHVVGTDTSRYPLLYLKNSETGADLDEVVEVRLGQTDAAGRLVVDDRAAFPAFYEVSVERTDEQGNALGRLGFGAGVEVVALRNGAAYRVSVNLLDGTANRATITAGS